MKAALAGFKTMSQADVQVGLDRTVEVNLQMGVAGVTETVEVSAVSPTVVTRRARQSALRRRPSS